MMRVSLQGIGLYAPGLPSWQEAAPVLRGETAWQAEPVPAVAMPLPSAERRRTSASTRAAWAAAAQALAGNESEAGGISTVFASSGGDGAILHQLCVALASAERAVSPTHFHNSVHNAPAGYYGIALGSRAPSSSLCCHRAPFAAGLLEAAVQVHAEGRRVLLVGFDLAAPFPLAPLWPAQQDFAVALLLAPPGPGLAQWHIGTRNDEPIADADQDGWIGEFAQANPMAQSLPLLAALAAGRPAKHRLPYVDGLTLSVEETA